MQPPAKRILVRSGKDPLRVVSPEATLHKNLPGRNLGNLLFSTAAHKVLSRTGTVVDSMGLQTERLDAGYINANYDVLVLPMANAFRRDFEASLQRYTTLIRKLKVPVVVLGIGAQSSIDRSVEPLASIRDTVVDFLRAALDKSASIGVRGEFTEHYVRSLGFRQVDVIGCPSMFLFGREVNVLKRSTAVGTESRIAVNASAVGHMGKLIANIADRYRNLVYIGQSLSDLELLLWSESLEESRKVNPFPKHVSHVLYQQNRVRSFVDAWTWISSMRTFDFSFGARIHGNVAAILAGTPAVVIAHDSRTLELAQYHDIPCRPLHETPPDADVAALYDEADFSALNKGHEARYRKFAEFLRKHRLPNIFDSREDLAAFDKQVESTAFPAPVDCSNVAQHTDLLGRLRWLRGNHDHRIEALARRLKALEENQQPPPKA